MLRCVCHRRLSQLHSRPPPLSAFRRRLTQQRAPPDPAAQVGGMRAAPSVQAARRVLYYSREEMAVMFNQTLELRSRRLAAGFIGFAIGLAGVIYVSRSQVKHVVIEEISDVATRSLGDDKMQKQAQQMTMQTLQALLQDEATVQHSVKFVSEVAAQPATRQALIALLVEALKSESVLSQALALTLWVLDDDKARKHLNGALMSAISSEAFLDVAAKFAVRWLAEDAVAGAVTELFRGSSLKLLEDEAVRDMAQQFVHGLLDQPHLQAKTGEHLWSAVRGWLLAPKSPKRAKAAAETKAAAEAARQAAAQQTAVQQSAALPPPSDGPPPPPPPLSPKAGGDGKSAAAAAASAGSDRALVAAPTVAAAAPASNAASAVTPTPPPVAARPTWLSDAAAWQRLSPEVVADAEPTLSGAEPNAQPEAAKPLARPHQWQAGAPELEPRTKPQPQARPLPGALPQPKSEPAEHRGSL